MTTLHANSWAELAAEWRRLWLSHGKPPPHGKVRLERGTGPVVVVWNGQLRVMVDAKSGAPVAAP